MFAQVAGCLVGVLVEGFGSEGGGDLTPKSATFLMVLIFETEMRYEGEVELGFDIQVEI